MQINNVNNSYRSPNFGHTFRVKIGIVNPDGSNYQIVNPATNRKLYKELNSKIVSMLNEDFLTRLKGSSQELKTKKEVSDDYLFTKKRLTIALTNADSDYRDFSLVRSVYVKNHYGYIATGPDVSIVENLKGATEIGKAKRDAILHGESTHSPYIEEVVNQFNRDARAYVSDPVNYLRSKDGNEIMLEFQFTPTGKNKNNKETYRLFDFIFNPLKTKTVMTPDKSSLLKSKINVLEYIKKTIQHQKNKLKDSTESEIDLTELMRSHACDSLMQRVSRRRIKVTDDSRQLKLNFDA